MIENEEKIIYLSVTELKEIIKKSIDESVERNLKSVKIDSENQDEFLRVSDVAKMLKITEQTVYQLKRKGQLPYSKIGKNIIFSKKEIEKTRLLNREKYSIDGFNNIL